MHLKALVKSSSQQTDGGAFGFSSCAPLLPYFCLLRSLQQKFSSADKLPRAFPKTSSFCEKMSWLTSLPWKNTRYSSWCKGCGPESGLQRPPTPSAGQGAAASTTGGSSSQLPPRPGHATQWGESGLTSPPRWVKSVLIGRAFKGLVLWPKSYFHLYPQTVIFHMPGMSPTFLTHSHGRLTRGEEGIFSYKDPTHPFSHWWALEPGEPRFEAQH